MKTMRVSLLTFVAVLFLSVSALAINEQEEIQLGAEAAAKFEQQYGLVNDPALVNRLNRIGQNLLTHAQRRNLPWRFRVLNVDAYNAAAFPGGFIYATRGLMNGMTDEELAFVIGHEIGHVEERHSIKQLESAQLRKIGLIAIAVGIGGGSIDENAARAIQLTDAIIGSQYSKGDERESDRIGMRMMAASGYDPVFALSAFQKLSQQSSGGTPQFLNTLLGSHPLPKERLNDGADLVTSIPYEPQARPPVSTPQVVSSSTEARAGAALEYTLSLLGQRHRDSLQRAAEALANGRGGVPSGSRLVRMSGPKAGGVSTLENDLLARPELKQTGQPFGVAVAESGDRLEVFLLLGGR